MTFNIYFKRCDISCELLRTDPVFFLILSHAMFQQSGAFLFKNSQSRNPAIAIDGLSNPSPLNYIILVPVIGRLLLYQLTECWQTHRWPSRCSPSSWPLWKCKGSRGTGPNRCLTRIDRSSEWRCLLEGQNSYWSAGKDDRFPIQLHTYWLCHGILVNILQNSVHMSWETTK